jgi:hypothetical protein
LRDLLEQDSSARDGAVVSRNPLVPAEVDLRDFPYMPIDIGRLFGSEFHARSDDGCWRAGVTLWLKSYHQVPAASIPDDDISLARLAEFGRDMKSWLEVKAGALQGWVKCSDGRLYHPVVAEKALEGWLEKLGQRKASAAGNAKRYNQKFDPVPFDDAISHALDMLAELNPSSRFLLKRAPKASRSVPDGSPDDLPSGSQEKGSKGKDSPPTPKGGEGEGFDDFWKNYPNPNPVERVPAEKEFEKLEGPDRPWAVSGAKGYADGFRANPTTHPISPVRFLRQRRFEAFARASASLPAMFQVMPGTPEWVAWTEYRGQSPPTDTKGGWSFPSRWPPVRTEAAE